MHREKQIQIPYSLYLELVQWAVCDKDSSAELKENMKRFIYDKADRDIKHDLYTKSKTAPSAAEREKARQEYLDKIGVPAEFRW